jgi:hypothetical protein
VFLPSVGQQQGQKIRRWAREWKYVFAVLIYSLIQWSGSPLLPPLSATASTRNGKQQNEEDDSEESDSEDDDSDDEENAVLDKLTQSVEKTTLDQPERSDSEDSEEGEGEGDVKERADVQNAVSSASVPGLTVPSQGTKKKNKGKKTKSSNQSGLLSLSSPAYLVSLLLSWMLLEESADIYPQEFDQLHARDEKQSKICKVCGFATSSNNKCNLPPHIP